MNRWTAALLLTLLIFTMTPPCDAEVLYKRYYVHNVNGKDVLTEPYSVQPNDYVIKILKARGEISHENFSLFLNIFKLINNQIADINRIHPGDRIFIPLRWLQPDSLPGQRRGIVDLPFITAAPVKRLLAENTATREVKKGDSVSCIIARSFGPLGTKSYRDGIKLFKLVNPDVKSIHRIYVGQTLTIPDPSVLKEAWAKSVLQSGGEVILSSQVDEDEPVEPSEAQSSVVYEETKEKGQKDPFKALPKLLGGVLLNRGRYYFPASNGNDFSVNLAESPILQLPKGRRILFKKPGGNLTFAKQVIIARHFKNLAFAETSEKPVLTTLLESVAKTFPEIVMDMPLSYAQPGLTFGLTTQWGFRHSTPEKGKLTTSIIVSEVNGPSQRFPMELAAYLRRHGIVIREALEEEALPPIFFSVLEPPAITRIVPTDRKHFVKELANALGLIYDPNVSISFAYAGVQVEASSNMLTGTDGKQTLVDFGNIYGDAIYAIESSGLPVLSITKGQYLYNITLSILTKLGIPYEENPSFPFGKGTPDLTGQFQVEGLLIRPIPSVKKLVISETLPEEIAAYLHNQGVSIISIQKREIRKAAWWPSSEQSNLKS
ncbi:MAG: LysM domain-containing protein [Desulfobacterales bacterium]|nr:LysM domain-containing protein [Desulfobacterales bacterium]